MAQGVLIARAVPALVTALSAVRMIALEKILVATDFGEASEAALTYGCALAHTFGASLHVLRVADRLFTKNIGGEASFASLPDLQRDVEV